jgi:hypothetical protein
MNYIEKPPAPDESRMPAVAGQTIVEVMYSPSRRVRGIITVDDKGVFRVLTQFWDTSDWGVVRSAFWAPGHLGSFTDTKDRALSLCREALVASAGYEDSSPQSIPVVAQRHPFEWRTRLRRRLPWWLIALGVADKGDDCERVGAPHAWYNIDGHSSGCYHCTVVRAGRLWLDGDD